MYSLLTAVILLTHLPQSAIEPPSAHPVVPLAQSFYPAEDDDRPELFLPTEGDSDPSNFEPVEGDSDPDNFYSDPEDFESPDLDELSRPVGHAGRAFA